MAIVKVDSLAALPRWRLLLLTLLSAVLLALALPNEFIGGAIRMFGLSPDESFFWGNAVLGIVCLAPALYAVARTPTFGSASVLGVVFGAVSTALANFWLMFFQGFSVWTYGGTILGYVGFNALLFPFLRGFSRLDGRYRPFLLAAAWAGYEYFKSVGFLGYPWGLIAYPVGDLLPLIQIVDITGVWGLSFLMAMINALVAEYALAGNRAHRVLWGRQAAFAAILLLCAIGYGLYRMSVPIPQKGTARLLLVQQNMDPWTEGAGNLDSITVNLALTEEGVKLSDPKPDLAVWSESSVSSVYVENTDQFYPADNILVPGIKRAGVPVLFGGMVVLSRQKQQVMNASVLVSPEGKILDTYGKIHPVPFAESVPFFEYPAVREFFRKVVGLWNIWTMGNRYTIYRVPLAMGGELAFGTPICFEDAFASHCRGYLLRGADLLLNITNDSWSKTWSAEIQHFQVARFRAVENRRVLVRSTNGGVSGVIGPKGEVSGRMPFFESTWRTVEVPIYRERGFTMYTRYGDWFAWLLLAVLLATLVGSAILTKKRAAQPRRAP
jgi:apolipoprotein N-acyltransferase